MNVTIEERIEAGPGATAIPNHTLARALRPWQELPGAIVHSIPIDLPLSDFHRAKIIVCRSDDREEGIA